MDKFRLSEEFYEYIPYVPEEFDDDIYEDGVDYIIPDSVDCYGDEYDDDDL